MIKQQIIDAIEDLLESLFEKKMIFSAWDITKTLRNLYQVKHREVREYINVLYTSGDFDPDYERNVVKLLTGQIVCVYHPSDQNALDYNPNAVIPDLSDDIPYDIAPTAVNDYPEPTIKEGDNLDYAPQIGDNPDFESKITYNQAQTLNKFKVREDDLNKWQNYFKEKVKEFEEKRLTKEYQKKFKKNYQNDFSDAEITWFDDDDLNDFDNEPFTGLPFSEDKLPDDFLFPNEVYPKNTSSTFGKEEAKQIYTPLSVPVEKDTVGLEYLGETYLDLYGRIRIRSKWMRDYVWTDKKAYKERFFSKQNVYAKVYVPNNQDEIKHIIIRESGASEIYNDLDGIYFAKEKDGSIRIKLSHFKEIFSGWEFSVYGSKKKQQILVFQKQ